MCCCSTAPLHADATLVRKRSAGYDVYMYLIGNNSKLRVQNLPLKCQVSCCIWSTSGVSLPTQFQEDRWFSVLVLYDAVWTVHSQVGDDQTNAEPFCVHGNNAVRCVYVPCNAYSYSRGMFLESSPHTRRHTVYLSGLNLVSFPSNLRFHSVN